MTDEALSSGRQPRREKGGVKCGRTSRPRSQVEALSLVIVAVSRGAVQPLVGTVGGDGTQHFGAGGPTEHELTTDHLQNTPEIP